MAYLEYAYDTAHNFVYDTIWDISHTESLTTYVHDTVDYHTLNTLPLVHINWGWGGYSNGYYTLSGTNHVGTYTQNEAMMIGLYPANQAPKDTTGHVNVYGTRGSISDGAGNLMYRPNTDRTWMIAAPGATRYSIKFLRLETEANADEVIFYKNGNMNDETGRYSGNTWPSTAFNIVADSVLVRFVSNGNDVTGRGFVFDFTATTPSGYCDEEVILPAGTGTITDKGNANVEEGTPYRPETTCTWRINGFDKLYISYPQIELGAGDFIDFFDVTQPTKQYPIFRIDQYNWPTYYIGYLTKFGDGASDVEPLAELTVTELLQIGDEMGIPYQWVHKVPTDDLPHSKTDEEKFGFTYATLDKYIRGLETPPADIKEKIDRMHRNNMFKLQPVETFKPMIG